MGPGTERAPGTMDVLADTVFLIDLWRESASPGPATVYAQEHATLQVGINWVVAGEFLAGAVVAGHDQALVTAFLSRYPIVHSDASVIRRYGDIYAQLRAANQLIGPNDLWISANALAHGLPVLTRTDGLSS